MTLLGSFPKPKIERFSDCEHPIGLLQGSCLRVTRMNMVTSVCTYIDSPFHRWSGGPDIAQLGLKEVVLPGLIVDASKRGTASFPVRAFAFME